MTSCTSYSSDPTIIISSRKAVGSGEKRIIYEIEGFPFNSKFMSYSKFNVGDTVILIKLTKY